MSLRDAVEQEESAANGVTAPDPDAAAQADKDVDEVEARRAADRERKAKQRERDRAGKPKRGPGRPPKDEGEKESAEPKVRKAKVRKELDPRVIEAVKVCLESMTLKEITPEFEARMQAALTGAIQYEVEVRLPDLADEYESEAALGCAGLGAVVTRFRVARQNAKKNTMRGRVVEDPPPPGPAADGGALS